MGAVMRYQPQGRIALAALPIRPEFVWVGSAPRLDSAKNRVAAIGAGIAQVDKSFGRASQFVGNTTNAITIAGGSAAAQTACTFMAVFQWDSGAANNFSQLIGLSTWNNGFRVGLNGGGGSGSTSSFGVVKGGVAVLNTVTITAGVPYVLVASHRQDTGEYYLLVKSLVDGTVLRATQTETSASLAGDGTYGVGIARTDFTGAWNGAIALALGSFDFLPESAARVWLDAPWQLFRAPERRILVASGAPAGTDTPVNPGAGSVAFTGYAPSIAQSINGSVAPGAGSVAITGYAPTITQPQAVALNVGSLAITGYAPTVTQAINQAVNPSAGTLAFTGYAPSVAQSANQAAAPGAGSVALTGYAPAVAQSAHQGVTPDAGSLTVTGYAPSVVQESASRSVLPAVGTLSVTGYAPTIEQTGAGGGADYGSSKKKRRRVLIGNKTYVVNDAELKRLLEMELLSDDAPEPAKQLPVDPKPLPDPEVAPVVIEAPKPVKPMEFAPVESIEQTQKFKRLMSGLQKQQDERAQMILRQIAEEIEEEDIEFLLLMG